MKTIQTFLILAFPITLFAQPQRCSDPPEMTSFCEDACIICDIDGFTGRHNSDIVGESPAQFAGECTDIAHNIQWIAFIAGSRDLKIALSVFNCELGRGLEFGLYKGKNCGNYVRISNCFGGGFNSIKPGGIGVIENSEPLIIGEYYYIVMDGALGDNCNWQFMVLEGETRLDPLETSGEILGDSIACLYSQNMYEVEPPIGATEFKWTLNGKLISRTERFPFTEVDLDKTGENTICVTAYNACHTAPPSCKKIFVPPVPEIVINKTICEEDYFEVADTTLSTAGFFEFRLSTQLGCDSLVFVNLKINSPTSTDLGQINICQGDTLFVNETSFSTAGVHETTKSNSLGCDSSILFNLFLIECNIQGAVQVSDVSCLDVIDGSLAFEITNGTPPFSYQMRSLFGVENESGTISTLNAPETINGLPIGSYLITIADEFANQKIFIASVGRSAPLSSDFMVTNYNGYNISCFEKNDGQIQMMAAGGSPPYNYSWSNGTNTAQQEALVEGTYLVTITDFNGCQLIDSITLNQPNRIVLTFNTDLPDCESMTTGQINIDATSGGVPPYLYKIDDKPFDTKVAFENLGPDDYNLQVKDANGCFIEESIIINFPIIPTIDLGQDKTINLGESIELIPQQIDGVSSISWRPDTMLSCLDCPSPMATPILQKTFLITTTSIDNCTASDSITIMVVKDRNVYVPNAFSPNNDGINDLLVIHAGPEANNVQSLRIFSRWGELIFEQSNFTPNSPIHGWNGMYQDRLLDSGVYIWQAAIDFIDGETVIYTGDVALVR